MISSRPKSSSCPGQEVGAVVPADPAQVDQPKERLVDERRGLQCVVVAFAAHLRTGEPPQFLVDERDQVVQGGAISAAPGKQQFGDEQSRPVTRCRPGFHGDSRRQPGTATPDFLSFALRFATTLHAYKEIGRSRRQGRSDRPPCMAAARCVVMTIGIARQWSIRQSGSEFASC